MFLALGMGTALAAQPLSVASVQARLFLNHSGTLSKPVDAKTELWNAVIGERNIPGPSNATFIDVRVQGEPGSFDPDARVELVVVDKATGKNLQSQAAEVGVLDVHGSYHVGFWIQKTGCVPLEVRARVAGSKVGKSLVIPFACGE